MTCSIELCEKSVYCKQLCRNHYEQLWKAENKTKRAAILEKYHKSSKYKNTSLKYRETPKGRLAYLKTHVKHRKLECSLTVPEYAEIIKSNCYYCGCNIFNSSYGYGLDRIDNSKGYEINNVLPCCGECNKLRMDRLSVEETIEVVKLLKKLRNKDNIWYE